MLQEKKLLRFILQEMQQNPAWRLIILKNRWLCPYCGEIGVENLRMDEPIEERILLHLLSGSCAGFLEGEGIPLDLESLRRKALLLTFKHKVKDIIRSDRSWHFTDLDGIWVCPYCAKLTGITLRDLDNQDEAVRDRTWNQISVHLLECPESRKGEGEIRSREELIERTKQLNRKKRARRMRRRIVGNPVFELKDLDRRWLCPFCVRPTDVQYPSGHPFDDEMLRAIESHLAHCAAYANREGRPHSKAVLKKALVDLNKELVLERVRRKVARHGTWQFADQAGHWYCPYCARATGVQLPTDLELETGALQGMWDHLSQCEEYTSPEAQVQPAARLQAVVATRNLELELRSWLKTNLRQDPRWSVRDRFGCWLCPYCRKVHKHIVLGEGGSILVKTLEQIADHLEHACTDFQPGVPPAARLEELRLIGGGPGLTAPAGLSLPEDAFVRSITREVAQLKEELALSEELKQELQEASMKQRRLLPQLPELPGFEFGCLFKPSRQVGGDFYTVFQVTDETLGIAIGDISGHGIDVAILMGLAKKLLEVHGRGCLSPAQTLILSNADIYPDLDARTFVTVFYGVLEPDTRRFLFSRAGHNPLILYSRHRTPPLQILDSKGMALGMDMGAVFASTLEELEVQLKPGDMLLQYTDGVPEAMNHENEEFGLDRLYGLVEDYGRFEAEYLLYKIDKALFEFQEGARQRDDITMFAMKVLE